MALAYLCDVSAMSNTMARDYFLVVLDESELELKIKVRAVEFRSSL